MAYLQVESGELSGQRYAIGSEPLTLGRTDDNQIVLDNVAVSSHHCQIVQEGDLCKIVDLESTNGTLLNEAPVKESFLQDGDVVNIGSVTFTFRSGDAQAAEPMDVEEEEAPEVSLPAPAVQGSSVPLFRPRPRKNLAWLPVILLVAACVVASAFFFLHRLFSY